MNSRTPPPPRAQPPPPKGRGGQPFTESRTNAPAYFSESQLPSCKSGFYTTQQEKTTRRKTCRFLEEAGRVLKLPRVTISTSMVFFHRFYAVHSFEEHDRFEVAVACILLAAKTEESPKKLVSILQECFRLKNNAMKNKTPQEGVKLDKRGYLDMKCQEYTRLKERILLLERVILHTIGFELSISHPYIHFGKIKKMVLSNELEYISSSNTQLSREEMGKMLNQLTQFSMNFANDSMHTSLCLQYPPDTIAYACIYLSGQFCKLRPSGGKDWLDILDASIEDLASIGIQMMELIADKKGMDESIFKSIRAELDKMKRKVEGDGNTGNRRPPPSTAAGDAKRSRN